jgi:hypothetical protein
LQKWGSIVGLRDYASESQRVKVTIQETSTELEPTSGDVYYPGNQQGSLSRRDVERSYTVTSNGHTASNATKELDDLMASLSEFKVSLAEIPVCFSAPFCVCKSRVTSIISIWLY